MPSSPHAAAPVSPKLREPCQFLLTTALIIIITPDSRSWAQPTALAAKQAAQRILTLATESLDMMRGAMNTSKESLERADAYVYSFYLL